MGTISNRDGRGWGRTLARMDGDEDDVSRRRLGMELRLAGTIADGDHCLSPCSCLLRRRPLAEKIFSFETPRHVLHKPYRL
jgi:hypothetical protein